MIAGLEDITDGELKIGGEVVNDRAPKDRDIAMVFQNYALYPHMTVRENMGFALKLAQRRQGGDRPEGQRGGARSLDLTQHLDRKPANLSGGQRQRVAMGRAIVRDPKAFLMDEPLSNLDAKLRVQMRTEVSRIQKRLGTTTVYVTHDQTEAMTLGDRVAVMRSGELQQVGAPQELYEHPMNIFVAGFIGSPAMNFLPVKVEGTNIVTPIGDVPLSDEQRQALEGDGKRRPHRRHPPRGLRGRRPGRRPARPRHHLQRADRRARVDGRRVLRLLLGRGPGVGQLDRSCEELAEDAGTADIPSAGEAGQVVARLEPASKAAEGQEAELWLDTSKVHLFDASNGQRLGG